MRNYDNATGNITHEAVELTRKAVQMAKRYGKRDSDGALSLNMTYKAFGLAFGNIGALRETIDAAEANFDRIGFFILRDCVQISYMG